MRKGFFKSCQVIAILLFVFSAFVGSFTSKEHQGLRLYVNNTLKLHYVELNWHNNEYLSHYGNYAYNIYRTEDGTNVYTLAKDVHNTQFYDFTVVPGHSYSYLISCTNEETKQEGGYYNVANVSVPK